MDGSDKRRLLVLGKSARPRCFRKQECLPVVYRANKKAWKTQQLFTTWLQKFDDDMVAEERRVVLMLDNCTAHNEQPKLTAVNLEFLPANTIAKSQPMDQGVIATVKAHYKKCICEKVILNLQRHDPLEVDLKAAIEMITASWWQVKATTISKCFRKARFLRNDWTVLDIDTADNEDVNAEDVWHGLVRNDIVFAEHTFDVFLNEEGDEINICEGATTDEQIIAAVCDTVEECSLEDDGDGTPLEVSYKDVLECVSML
ncbi:tigger transposable element-derived protein 6-like [Ornithodoros turicata]|uniref:tigger transposable element-derived protein 6-like n=1 Tax=Ornithodoros turicata TaxID=34597 RepID=UPI0031398EF8